MTGAELAQEFGGRWDGGGREIHGLVERDGRTLKIELLRSSEWVCSVFYEGSCVSTARDPDATASVRGALEALAP